MDKAILKQCWSLVRRVSDEADADDADIVAAGLAFYGLLGLFPALLATVSVYGLVADPAAIQRTIYGVARALPASARDLVIDELSQFVARPARSLSLGVVLAFLAVLWSSSSAMSVLVRAINVAYDLPQRRSFLHRRRVAVLFTLGAMFGLFVLIPLVALLPKLLTLFHVGAAGVVLRWVLMLTVAWLAFAVLYRYAVETRPVVRLARVAPGATFAALLWVLLCGVYSAYVQYLTSFSATYGALTGVIVLEFWLYISGLILVYGAELNAELEREPVVLKQPTLSGATKRPTPRSAINTRGE